MKIRQIALIALGILIAPLAWAEAQEERPSAALDTAIAYDLDRRAGAHPTEAELEAARSAAVDELEFQQLIGSATHRSGDSVWLGGFLVVHRRAQQPSAFYRVSYYGAFFSKVGEDGYFVVPAGRHEQWRLLLLEPGALAHLIEQRPRGAVQGKGAAE